MKIANIALGMEPYGSRLCDWLRSRRPDIATLQKIGSKLPPNENLREIGYESELLLSGTEVQHCVETERLVAVGRSSSAGYG